MAWGRSRFRDMCLGLGFQGYGLCGQGLEDVVWGVSGLFGVRAPYIITIY